MDVAVLSSSAHFYPNRILLYYSKTIFQGNSPTGDSVRLQPQEWALGGNLLSARENINACPNKWWPYQTPILLFVRLRVLFHLILRLAELSKHSTSKYSTNKECVFECASIVACEGMYVHTTDENSDGRCGQWNDERRASTQWVDDSTYTLPNDRLLNI